MANKTCDKISCKLTNLTGIASKFLESELPTLRDVLKYGLFLRMFEENHER